MMSQDEEKLREIFFPHMAKPVEQLKKGNISLVHYTSAETALKIIKEEKVWMRNANYMADYSEIRTGTRKIKDFFDPQTGNKEFWASLDKIKSGLKDSLIQFYNGWLQELELNTFLLCVSEHLNYENDIGRLSMWRGYGRGSGVALVLNKAPFLTDTISLGAESYPVIYRNHNQHFKKIVEGISQNLDFLSKQTTDVLLGNFLRMLLSFAFCLKHKGFEEEKEWRVVYLPKMEKAIRENSHLKEIPLPIKSRVETIDRTPQEIHEIPLEKILGIKEEETLDLEIKYLFERLIIGPCKFPDAVYEAFLKILSEKGVEDVENKIHISDIPLRM